MLLSRPQPLTDDELEASPDPETPHAHLAKEVLDVLDVAPEEVEGGGMIVLDALRDVDDVEVAFVVEDVVLREVGVDEFTLVEEFADVED